MIVLFVWLLVAPPSDNARQHYKDGLAHYDAGEYDQAIAEFRQAWDATHSPPLLFDLAQCYRLKGDTAQAARLYHAYLSAFPEAPNRDDVEARLRELEGPLFPARAKPVCAAVAPAHEIDRTAGHGKKVSGLIVGASGVAMAATAVYFGLRAQDDADQIGAIVARQGKWDATARALYDDGDRAQTTANVLYIAGGAAVVSGAVLYWLGWRDAHATNLAIAPLPGGTAIALSGRF
jgi:tetratricopeptide (TPR) repeat protein